MLPGKPPSKGERSYKASLLRGVIHLATRIQMKQKEREEETLTASQIEAIGKELGLDPAIVRQVLDRLDVEPALLSKKKERNPELLSLVAAFAIPVIWGSLAYLLHSLPAAHIFFWFIGTPPLAVLLGFLAGKRELSKRATALLMLALAPSLFPFSIPFGIVGWLVAARLAEFGVSLREQHWPLSRPSAQEPVLTRQHLLDQLFDIQHQLESQKQYCVFLSVDVVSSGDLAKSGPELAVEYSFNQFRRWVESLVKTQGGQVQSSAGDGVMCLFSDGAAAVKTAHLLQDEIADFNAKQNHLPLPFRLRCGISAGEVALEEGVSLRDIQSPEIYRAAVLQKQAEAGGIVIGEELAVEALKELPQMVSLPRNNEDRGAYSWQPESPSQTVSPTVMQPQSE